MVEMAIHSWLLRACPDICILIWQALVQHGAAPMLQPATATHLIKAAIACTSMELAAEGGQHLQDTLCMVFPPCQSGVHASIFIMTLGY